MELQPWLTIAERLGVPVAVMAAILIALFWSFRWGAKHVVTPLVGSHTKLIDTLGQTAQQQANALDDIKVSTQQQAHSMEILSGNQRDLVEMMKNDKNGRDASHPDIPRAASSQE